MAMIKGQTVILRKKEQIGEDDFGAPIYETTDIEVENVLIAPSSSQDVITSQDLFGKKASYTLAIPKGDMNIWEDTTVVFWGKEWNTIGFPLEGIEENIPLEWNRKVMVERYG